MRRVTNFSPGGAFDFYDMVYTRVVPEICRHELEVRTTYIQGEVAHLYQPRSLQICSYS